MIGSYPASLEVQKLSVGKLISSLLFGWGLFSMVLAGAKNFGTIFAMRFLLSISEFDIGIAVGLGSVTNTAIRSWQLVFLLISMSALSSLPSFKSTRLTDGQVVGWIAVVLNMICFFFLPSGPSDAKFLTREEKLAALWRIARNQTGIKHGKVLKYQIYEALRDFRVWCLLMQQFTIGMASGALAGYYSAFHRGFGWSPIESVRYQLPIGAVQLFATIVTGYLASRYRNRTIIIILVLAIFAVVATVRFYTIPADQKIALTSCTWNVSVYGIANFAGPFVFDPKEAPRYPSATTVLGVMLGVGWVVTAAMGIWMWNGNRRRDAKAAAGDHTYDPSKGNIDGFTDCTDKEKSSRYRYCEDAALHGRRRACMCRQETENGRGLLERTLEMWRRP
ncbi:uncharacterized protein Z519_06737 [Cladophialophora bantiana CBS 173.52]|uniref:Major facilitator superfamily (MFS) profile domain-containing protein n=1 Tax=Cladophialophora bantiana (strain ATCC 10958 / CBS 173.52 / CDC B-1940 / NIH 8579) TaxID=1442370 RepID=A0A0D2HHZ9_CLAB1|nr:uncharacterized protein Z519_06737 [Cladophialophora bantiana CBS 173.52]KIW92888.1 hypothetical protein Z519_06737 [Cladophialophora bantiana CBS 173.52]